MKAMCQWASKGYIFCILSVFFHWNIGEFGAAFAKPEASLAELKQFIYANNITTVEQLFERLPEDFKKTFVPMKESNSQHMADTLHPRIILMVQGNAGELLLSLSTHPDDPRRNVVEAIEYNRQQAKWNFQAITFNSPSVNAAGYSQHYYPSFSELNPQSCVGCHGPNRDDLRPNWEQYPFWPGAVGDGSHMRKVEADQMVKYHNSRYRVPQVSQQLQDTSLESQTRNQLSRQLFTDKRLQHFNFAKYKKGYTTPAFSMHVRIEGADMFRLVRLIRNSDYFGYYKYAIYAALNECPDIPDFIPKESTALLAGKEALKNYYKDIIASQESLRKLRKERKKADLDAPIIRDRHNKTLAALRFLFESRGIDISNWSNNFIAPKYFLDDFFSLGQLLKNFDRDLYYFYDKYEPYTGKYEKEMCHHLKQESHRALKYLQENSHLPKKIPTKNNHITRPWKKRAVAPTRVPTRATTPLIRRILSFPKMRLNTRTHYPRRYPVYPQTQYYPKRTQYYPLTRGIWTRQWQWNYQFNTWVMRWVFVRR